MLEILHFYFYADLEIIIFIWQLEKVFFTYYFFAELSTKMFLIDVCKFPNT